MVCMSCDFAVWTFPLCTVESLTAFIAGHVMEKMCVPCKLVLPDNGGGGGGGAMVAQVTRRQPAGIAKAMQSGAGELIAGQVSTGGPGIS